MAELRSNETMAEMILRNFVGGAYAATKLPIQAIDTVIALATASIGAMFESTAATITTPHISIPHNHTHPPAMPTPLPNIGVLCLGGAYNVLIYGLPAARAGDIGIGISCGCFAPLFQVSTGSSKVFIGPNRAARAFDFTISCKQSNLFDPATLIQRLDSAVNIANAGLTAYTASNAADQANAAAHTHTDPTIAASLGAATQGYALTAQAQALQAASNSLLLAAQLTMNLDPTLTPSDGTLLPRPFETVWMGGFQLPPTLKALLGVSKVLSVGLRQVAFFPLSSSLFRLLNALPRRLGVYTGHPVDVVFGRLVIDACDLELHGALPLRFARSYSSAWGERVTSLGRGWSHNWDQAIWLEHGQVVYRMADGREVELAVPEIGQELFCARERLTLRRVAINAWQVQDHAHGLTSDFEPVAGDPQPTWARLISQTDRCNRKLCCTYNAVAQLSSVSASDGRGLALRYDDAGRLVGIDAPDPEQPGFVPHTRFDYEDEHLVAVHDAVGHTTRYRYEDHRIVEEALPDGQRFYFEYETGDVIDYPRCVRTYGTGGILDHRLIYDRAHNTTVVINAHQESTVYKANEQGLVVEVHEANGAVTRHTYDQHRRKTTTVDPLGHTTQFTYDERGNCIRDQRDGAGIVTTAFDPRWDLPTVRRDAVGGEQRWSYDDLGRVTRHTDALGRSTVYLHAPGEITTIYPDGRCERRLLDAAGRLMRCELPEGRAYTIAYDRRGARIRGTDEQGRSETWQRDRLGRVTSHCAADGQRQHRTYDACGRVIRRSGPHTELYCNYTGYGWLASCGTGTAAPVVLERDLEGRITRIAGPEGTLLALERDCVGRVGQLRDVRGHVRRLTRDLCGRVIAVRSRGGSAVHYQRDAAGRICQVLDASATKDCYDYREDGALLAATRHDAAGHITAVRRELDLAGRVIREHQGEHLVESTYDACDQLVRLRSSLGADIRFAHDVRGLARVEVLGRLGLRFERDRDGRELARHLPGDLLSWWRYDQRGRPTEHGLLGSRPPQIHRHRHYHWDAGGRIAAIEEAAGLVKQRPRASVSAPATPTVTPAYNRDGYQLRVTSTDRKVWDLSWDGAGMLVRAVSDAGDEIVYRYDALGRRISRRSAGSETRWLWHGDVPVHHWDPQHEDAITWVFEPGRAAPLARLTATTTHTIVGDHLGSPLAVLDDCGQLAWASVAGPHQRLQPRHGDPALCPFRHPGQTADPDTGLAYNRFREFDMQTGRYLSPDPLGLLGSFDLYAHVADPTTMTDVLGLAADTPEDLRGHIVAELARDFPLHDLSPAQALALVGAVGSTHDKNHPLVAQLANPRKLACG